MSHRRVGAALLCACAIIPLAAPAPAPAAKKRDGKVMSRTIYLGADLIPLAAEQTQDGFERAAAERYQTVLNNDFQTRAKGIASEIQKYKPDLVALQEAARWLRGPDGVKDGRTTPAQRALSLIAVALAVGAFAAWWWFGDVPVLPGPPEL